MAEHGMNANDLAALGMVMERFGFRGVQQYTGGGQGFMPRQPLQVERQPFQQDRGGQQGFRQDRSQQQQDRGPQGGGGFGGGRGPAGDDGIERVDAQCDVCKQPLRIRKVSLDERKAQGLPVTHRWCRDQRGGGRSPFGAPRPAGAGGAPAAATDVRSTLADLADRTADRLAPPAPAPTTAAS